MITELTVRISNAGAGNVIMWFMVVLSVASVILIIERVLHFRRACGDIEVQYARLSELLSAEDFEGALQEFSEDQTMVARVTCVGLKRIANPAAVMRG